MASSLSLHVGYLFGRFQRFVVAVVVVDDGCSAVSCDLGIFVRRGDLTSSTPPSCWPM